MDCHTTLHVQALSNQEEKSCITLEHSCKGDFVYTFTGSDKLYRNYLGLQNQNKKAFPQETRFILHSLQHFFMIVVAEKTAVLTAWNE